MSSLASDKQAFAEKGILLLRGRLSKKDVEGVKRLILSELERLKLRVNGKIAASKVQKLPIFQQMGKLGQMVQMGSGLDQLFSDELVAFMSSLVESNLKPSHSHPQLLLSLPHKEEWSLNRLNWHLDLTPSQKNEIPGVQAFVLIDDLQPRGGATLALAGSHRLHYVKAGKNAHGVLRENRIFSELFEGSVSNPEKFFKPQVVDGVEVSIVEMSGKAGDVFLMDMRVLHSPSINSTKNIRMMATNRFIK